MSEMHFCSKVRRNFTEGKLLTDTLVKWQHALYKGTAKERLSDLGFLPHFFMLQQCILQVGSMRL